MGETGLGDGSRVLKDAARIRALGDIDDILTDDQRKKWKELLGEPFDTALSRDDADYLFQLALKQPPVAHPVVRIHPDTQRPSLFVNPGFTTHIAGLSRIKSEHILRLLYAHMTQPEFTLRHQWQTGDVVMWDNRSTMHYAANDYGSVDRRMRRITLRGDRPVGPTGFISHVADDPLVAVR